MQHKSQAHIFFLFAFSIFEVLLDCSNFIIHSIAPSKTLASKVVLLSLCDSRYLQDYVIQKNTKDGSLSPLCLNCKLFVLSWKRKEATAKQTIKWRKNEYSQLSKWLAQKQPQLFLAIFIYPFSCNNAQSLFLCQWEIKIKEILNLETNTHTMQRPFKRRGERLFSPNCIIYLSSQHLFDIL